MSDEVDDRPEGAIGATKLDPRLAIILAEGDGGTWTVAALAGLATNLYPKLATMLRRLEWAGTVCGDGGGYTCCPLCEGQEPEGHVPTCDLATLLKELP